MLLAIVCTLGSVKIIYKCNRKLTMRQRSEIYGMVKLMKLLNAQKISEIRINSKN